LHLLNDFCDKNGVGILKKGYGISALVCIIVIFGISSSVNFKNTGVVAIGEESALGSRFTLVFIYLRQISINSEQQTFSVSTMAEASDRPTPNPESNSFDGGITPCFPK